MNRIYLDSASTTGLDPNVAEVMRELYLQQLGNASSIHQQGVRAAREIEKARDAIALKIHATAEELFFTSCGTESNNLALEGFCRANRNRGHHLIVSQIEHPSILASAQWLSTQGFEVTYLPVDGQGCVDPEQLIKAINNQTILVSIMHANNEVGTIQKIGQLGKICRDRGIAFHTDACQSFTKVPINVQEQNIDLLTLSAHKVHGPRGVAALYIRKGVKVAPILQGGGQESGIRSGTYHTEGIVGFHKAVEMAQESDVHRMGSQRQELIKHLVAKVPHLHLHGAVDNSLCNIINFKIPAFSSKKILFALDKMGISISIGSACSSAKKVPSYVLMAMGYNADEASESIRVSLSKWTTPEEIDLFIKRLLEIINGKV